MRDIIPESESKFYEWQLNFKNYVRSRYPSWGIPEDVWTANEALEALFEEKYASAVNPMTRTSVAVLVKNQALRNYKKDLRQMIKSYINYNRLVSNGDRQSMGLRVYKVGKTPAAVATDSPDNRVTTSLPGYLSFRYFQRGGEHRKGKPEGQRGVELLWVISETPPADWSELLHSSFCTHSPLTLFFENHLRGKTLYYAMRWENTRGQKGPLSVIQSIIIP